MKVGSERGLGGGERVGRLTQGVKMKTQQATDRANKYAFELILTNPLAVSVYYGLDVRKATSLLFPP